MGPSGGELRPPTARIRFGLEMLSMASTDQERQHRIDAMDEDLTELDQLVEELLVLMRAGEDVSEEAIEAVPAAARRWSSRSATMGRECPKPTGSASSSPSPGVIPWSLPMGSLIPITRGLAL